MSAEVVEVADRTWSVSMDMRPDGFILTSSAYLLRDADDRLHLIDPGWDLGDNLERLAAAATSVGGSLAEVATITATHMHADHLGLAARVRDASGARVVVSRVEQSAIRAFHAGRDESLDARIARWGVPLERHRELREIVFADSAVDIAADALVDDGDTLPIPGRSLRVVLTPGHTPGSISLHEAERGLLFTGDHVLPDYTPAPGAGGRTVANPLGEYLHSLERVSRFDDALVLPGHGGPFHGIAARARTIAEHHLRRTRDVLAAITSHPNATVWEIAEAVRWSHGFAGLTGRYLLSGLRQIDTHLDFLQTEAGRSWPTSESARRSERS